VAPGCLRWLFICKTAPGAPHLMRAKRTRRWHISKSTSYGVCNGDDACWETRGEDAMMLTCSGCRVARFCSTDHHKMTSKKAAWGGSLLTGRHQDICGVLSKWREVVKDGVSPDLCTAEVVAFL
jgi:asparagine synthetase A